MKIKVVQTWLVLFLCSKQELGFGVTEVKGPGMEPCDCVLAMRCEEKDG